MQPKSKGLAEILRHTNALDFTFKVQRRMLRASHPRSKKNRQNVYFFGTNEKTSRRRRFLCVEKIVKMYLFFGTK